MPEEEYIETAPQPAFLLLTYGQYFKLNHDLSIAKGWQLGQPTERSREMNPPTAKINITYDAEGNETGYDEALVMQITSKEQEDYPELFAAFELHSSYVPVESESNVPVEGEIESDVIDWTLNHYQAQGVDNSGLVTFIASQDVNNYPPIPDVGEWCEARIYSYNGDKVKCLQPHTRMSFTPEETPALWFIIPTVTEGYPEWVQPTGAHDAYAIGDRVSFNGNNYESLINANVWSPAVYPAGWKQL